MSLPGRFAAAVAVVGLAALLVPAVSAAAPPADATPGRYIVVLRDTVGNPGTVAAEHRDRFGAEVSFVYGAALKGYAATIPAARLGSVRADSRVQYVSDDRPIAASVQSLPTGIDRIQGDTSRVRSPRATRRRDGGGRLALARLPGEPALA